MNHALLTIALLTVTPKLASAECVPGACKPANCCQDATCSPCTLVCQPEVRMEMVKKSGWEVECEYICVPKVHCPLFRFFGKRDDCETCVSGNGNNCFGRPRCAKVKQVKKLKQVNYECQECVVEWNLRCVSAGCSHTGCLKCRSCGPTPGACAALPK